MSRSGTIFSEAPYPWTLQITVSGNTFNAMNNAAHGLARTLLEAQSPAGYTRLAKYPLASGGGGGGGEALCAACKVQFETPLEEKIKALRDEADKLEKTLKG